MSEGQTIVLKNGSSAIQAGFAGEEAPDFVFPSVIGRPIYVGASHHDSYVGTHARAMTGSLRLTYPIERGMFTSCEAMETIWHHTFYDELRVDPAEHPVLLIEPLMNTREHCEKMTQVMFETFNVPFFYIGLAPVMSLCSSGRTTGIVLEIGDGVSQVLPICGGYSLLHASKRVNLGGRDLTAWLETILHERGYWFDTQVERRTVGEIKETLAYVALDFEAELLKAATTTDCNATYMGCKVLDIGNERFRCPELLFKPSFNELAFDGIHQTLFDSIMMCDDDIRPDLWSNIVLSGGSTMFTGFPERIEKEITRLVPPTERVKVVAPPERKYAAWIGGSIFASLATFPEMVITFSEYCDAGPAIVHRKCF
jgi:actin